MKCPKCSAAMEAVKADDVQIDRCTQCGSLWFDEFELGDLRAKEGAEKVDAGQAKKSTQQSQVQLNCPKCSAVMLKMVDAQQPHIWYETCKICGGSFLDAGEFKDIKQLNIIDKIKDMLVKMKGGRSTAKTKLSPEVIRKIVQ